MSTNKSFIFAVAILAVTGTICNAADKSKIQELIDQLSEKQPKDVRLKAINQLDGSHITYDKSIASDTALALPELTRCLHDKDPKIRSAAIYSITDIVLRQNLELPLDVVETLFDEDREVRLSATTNACCSAFKKYPAKAKDLLLRALLDGGSEVRQAASAPLAQYFGNKKEVVEALQNATKDEDFLVRHNAICVLHTLLHELEPFTRQLTEVVFTPLADKDNEERSMRKFMKPGCSKILRNLSREQTEDFVQVLKKFLTDKSPILREGAASLLGGMDKEKPKDNAKAKEVLKKLSIKTELEKLLNDPDPNVQVAVKSALNSWED
jgi:HEAT repeat protein